MSELIENSLNKNEKVENTNYLKNARNCFSGAVIGVLFLSNPVLGQDIKQIDTNEIMLSIPLGFKYNSKKYGLDYEGKNNPALGISFGGDKYKTKIDSIGLVEEFGNGKWGIGVLKNRGETFKGLFYKEKFYGTTTVSAELNQNGARVVFSIPLGK